MDVLPGGAAAGTCPSAVQDYWIGRPGHAGRDGILPSDPTKFGSHVATVLKLSSAVGRDQHVQPRLLQAPRTTHSTQERGPRGAVSQLPPTQS